MPKTQEQISAIETRLIELETEMDRLHNLHIQPLEHEYQGLRNMSLGEHMMLSSAYRSRIRTVTDDCFHGRHQSIPKEKKS